MLHWSKTVLTSLSQSWIQYVSENANHLQLPHLNASVTGLDCCCNVFSCVHQSLLPSLNINYRRLGSIPCQALAFYLMQT